MWRMQVNALTAYSIEVLSNMGSNIFMKSTNTNVRYSLRQLSERIQGFLPCFLGLAFIFAWNTSTTFLVSRENFGDNTIDFLITFMRCISLLALGFLGRYSNEFIMRRGLIIGVAVWGTLAMMIISFASGAITTQMAYLQPVCAIIVGMAQGFLMLAWFVLYARLDFFHSGMYFIASNVLSTLIPVIIIELELPIVTGIITTILPLLGALLCLKAQKTLNDSFQDGNQDIESIKTENNRWSFPVKPAILIMVFAFVAAYARSSMVPEFRIDLVGASVFALLVLIVFIIFADRFEIRLFYWCALPLGVAALLCIGYESTIIGTLGCFFANIGFMLFQYFTCIMLFTVSYRFGIEPLWLFGPVQSLRVLGTLTGNLIGKNTLSSIAVGNASLFVSDLLVVILVILFMVFLTDKDIRGTWGIVPPKATHNDEENDTSYALSYESYFSTLIDVCARIARKYGLTHREEEVLVLLAQDKTLANIEQELSISTATAKSHATHIYAKLDVHRRQEVVELVHANMPKGLRFISSSVVGDSE